MHKRLRRNQETASSVKFYSQQLAALAGPNFHCVSDMEAVQRQKARLQKAILSMRSKTHTAQKSADILSSSVSTPSWHGMGSVLLE